jgi:taurine transport system substrate-binding protein
MGKEIKGGGTMTVKITRRGFIISAMVAAGLASGNAIAMDKKIVIGNFPTPLPYHVFLAEFAKNTGWQIDWRRFSAGTEVIAAMASGDIKIGELGSPPVVIGAAWIISFSPYRTS